MKMPLQVVAVAFSGRPAVRWWTSWSPLFLIMMFLLCLFFFCYIRGHRPVSTKLLSQSAFDLFRPLSMGVEFPLQHQSIWCCDVQGCDETALWFWSLSRPTARTWKWVLAKKGGSPVLCKHLLDWLITARCLQYMIGKLSAYSFLKWALSGCAARMRGTCRRTGHLYSPFFASVFRRQRSGFLCYDVFLLF